MEARRLWDAAVAIGARWADWASTNAIVNHVAAAGRQAGRR